MRDFEWLDLWLNPQSTDIKTIDAILEDRERPYCIDWPPDATIGRSL